MEKQIPNRALMRNQNPHGISLAKRIINHAPMGKHSATCAPMNKQNFNVAPMDKENASGAPILDNRIIVLHQLCAI